MTTETQRPSIRERIRAIEAGEPVIAAHFLKDEAALLLASGEVVLAGASDRRISLHEGGILDSASDGAVLVTGGDDGRVVVLDGKGEPRTVHDSGGTWIDRVAVGPSRSLAWSAGRTVTYKPEKGETKSLSLPSACGGIAFFPKGQRLALAHYNGATLWYPNVAGEPQKLEWKGSHLGITVSADQRFVVTTMQEPQLHGWRLEDGQHMRMSGYPGKTRSIHFSARGRWLATSGAESVVLWPFFGGGPMGKAPTELAGGDEVLCSAVAFHPQHEVVAAGFGDGLVLMAEVASGKVVPVAPPQGSAVSTLAWNAAGTHLAFGTEAGLCGVVDLSKR